MKNYTVEYLSEAKRDIEETRDYIMLLFAAWMRIFTRG